MTAPPRHAPIAPAMALHSRLVQRLRRRYEAQLPLLAPGAPDRASLEDTLRQLRAQGLALDAALRVLRQLVIERLVVLDCEQQAPLATVTQAMTELAEVVLDTACQAAQSELDERHGAPLKANGERAELWIMGMGKLGARELNVSSDIDLIYVYDEDGETTGTADGRGRISCQEYFARVVKRVYALVGEVTEHGFVFRVDLALRPNGNSGPSVVSLAALEEYFLVQGREWERFAWMKSRVVAPRQAARQGSAQALRGVVLPFVFRRYLDYRVFDALRVLHRQIRDHARAQTAHHPERTNDVKLGRGGIREIEFIVQLLQVVRGGQFPELRTRPTLDALTRLTQAGLMPADAAAQLAEAYVFLRRVEHRAQYLDDQQTHVVPTAAEDVLWVAQTLGFATADDFQKALAERRETVAREFDTLLGASDRDAASEDVPPSLPAQGSEAETELLVGLPPALQTRLHEWLQSGPVSGLRDTARQRLARLLQRTCAWYAQAQGVAEQTQRSAAIERMTDWIEPLLRRESYLALLIERPAIHERLLKLLASARWPARYLRKHPGVIDELASQSLYASRFDAEAFEAELQARVQALSRTGEDDDENLLNLLRRAHHAEVFRTLARDVEGLLTVEQVADDLSALADAVLRVTLRWCWTRLKNRHREKPHMAIVAYGKLGGKELGYGSDLDIVFVYDDPHERAQEVYSALVRKLINWLTVKTGEGDLFEIDTALRPNGNSGLLVTTFEAYADYQQQRGSNTAWTWEHQAMTRARCAVGSSAQAERFDAVRQAVIATQRDPLALKNEIVAMRERMRQAHRIEGQSFDIKHSPGGMVDVEFAVQYLLLAHAHAHAPLLDNVGNIALLERAEQVGLLPEGVGQAAADAYRTLRHVQHRARLNEEPTQVPLPALAEQQRAVLALWHCVFGQELA